VNPYEEKSLEADVLSHFQIQLHYYPVERKFPFVQYRGAARRFWRKGTTQCIAANSRRRLDRFLREIYYIVDNNVDNNVDSGKFYLYALTDVYSLFFSIDMFTFLITIITCFIRNVQTCPNMSNTCPDF